MDILESEESEEEMYVSDDEDDKNQDEENVDTYTFEVFSIDEMVRYMLNVTAEVSSVINMPETTTRILLSHYKWDKMKLMEQFYEGDQDKIFEEACIVNPYKVESSKSMETSNKEIECQICYCSVPLSNIFSPNCGHRFCTDCWCRYLTVKIMTEGEAQAINCAGIKCKIPMDYENVMKLIEDPHIKLRYQQLMTNSFVECSRLLKWCPTPDCNCAFKVQFVAAKPVVCRCGKTICFQCDENWHEPIDCNPLKHWKKLCKEESKSLEWISRYTKKCPNCQAPIEKNGGCNHMICRKCNKDFNWTSGITVDPALESSREHNDRFWFYSTRYIVHSKSLKLEKQLYVTTRKKMDEMREELNLSLPEVQFLEKAVDVLTACRKIVMNCYAFMYYLEKTNQYDIFENNLRDLENATEMLSGYLENEINKENQGDIKQKVLDLSGYCSERRKVLLRHVDEGREKKWWNVVKMF